MDCKIGADGEHPRLLTYLIYLNPNWQESDGGTFVIYEKWPEKIVQEVLTPTMGKGILFRADKMHHSAEFVETIKRAITLFINIKKVETEEDELPIVRNVDMPEDMQKDAMMLAKEATQRFRSESDIADYIKTQYEEKYEGDWHCIVGRNYGSSITPLDGHFIYF